LPKTVHAAVTAGKEAGVTCRDNTLAFSELTFAPHVADLPASRDPTTSIMGQPVAMPVAISPVGVQAIHPDGEVAVARAAATRDTLMCLSSFASRSLEDVVAAHPRTFFQLYWIGSRGDMETRVERARQAGAVGLIVTLDWTFSHGRDWNSVRVPGRLDPLTVLRMAPGVLSRPRWLARYLRRRSLPDLKVPNLAGVGQPAPTFSEAYERWRNSPLPTWDDVAWLRDLWGGPLLVKGICRPDDARRAVDIGATAISVSNHGGNNLDGSVAPIRVLPSIVDAVGHDIEVLLDGGVRRGSDVVKAIALGARAVLIGRAYLWGLAARGQTGVEEVLDIFRAGIDATLMGLGRGSVHDLTRDDLLIPRGFQPRLDG
jgi:L-lactate dehydrogenase (cytochrome)/glycolate oxidase